jgi:predicted nucleotidyltransferase
MNATIAECRWPDLQEPYLGALKEAVSYLLKRYENVLGILVAGSILRGSPDRTSDLDIYFIHAKPERQRLQKFFNGIPAEIFVNPPSKIEDYFREEQAEGRPIAAHMWATGFVLFEADRAIQRLRQLAREYLASQPTISPESLVQMRYFAATGYEDALDVIDRDPASGMRLLHPAVNAMLHYAFLKNRRFLPREKELLARLVEIDPLLAGLAHEFYLSADLERRLELAQQIADSTIEARGFIEWESPLEAVP